MMPRFRGRTASACSYCRSQKIRCSGGNPCSKCQASKKQCVFSSSDRLVSVPESYLRQLENQTQGATSRPRQQEYRPERHTAVTGYDEGPIQGGTPVDRLISDSTTEHFISKLTKVYSHRSQDAGFATDAGVSGDGDGAIPPKHTYISLEYDNAQQTISIKLPPHSYASYLFGQFETFIGSDYYWFRNRIFRAKLDSIYHATRLQSEDRIWLACFSVVMALGESYSDNSAPAFTLGIADGVRADTLESASPAQTVPPGFEFFKQALLLVQFPYEEPTLEQIEAINLITFYSYSLNRRKTAYIYAGMAIRIARLLGLSNEPPASSDVEDKERHLGLWWTVTCMELMTCTELSMSPLESVNVDSLSRIDSQLATSGDATRCLDTLYLKAQVKLCRIKYRVTKAISEYRAGDADEIHPLINPCLQELHNWKSEFQLALPLEDDGSFTDSVLAIPAMRTIASLLLRYNQCFILLIRPLLLKQLYSVIQESRPPQRNVSLIALNAECMRAATDNCLIQKALSRCHRIAKFGFWESLHVFSSLTIHVVAQFIEANVPGSFGNQMQQETYEAVRQLLRTMAAAGNCASQDHERMIEKIENLFVIGAVYNGPTENIEDFIGWSGYDFGSLDFDFLQ